jgi:hypothetical protein
LIFPTNKIVDNTVTCCLLNCVSQLENLLEGGSMLGTFTNMDIDPVIPAENGYTHKESTGIINPSEAVYGLIILRRSSSPPSGALSI